MRRRLLGLAILLLAGCATPGQPMTWEQQQQQAQAAQVLVELLGIGLQAQQASQQQKQINAYNAAVIQQQQAGARILNAVATQAEQK